jgi:hypothetical protein
VSAVGVGLPQPVGYTVSARWSPSSRTLTGTESIRLRDGGSGPLPFAWLRLYPNDSDPGQADGCRQPRIKIKVISGARIDRYAVACSAARLRLLRAVRPGEGAVVSLHFTIHVPTATGQFGRSAGVDLIGRAMPLLVVRDREGWHLDPDTATGDPTYSLVAAWKATIRVPARLSVASTGAEVSNTVDARSGLRVIVASTPHARDFGLAIGRMSRRLGSVDGVRVRVFYSSRYSRASADEAMRGSLAAIRRYTAWYGPYGAPEFDVVLGRLGADSQELPEIVFSDPDIGTIAHEVAHQWFYAIVGDDQYREPWLDESFASWNEEQFAPGSYPCNPRRPLGSRQWGLTRGLNYYEHRPNEYDDVIYRGGSCGLTALEGMLGRTRLLALLREEVARYRYGVIHTRDFVRLLANVNPATARRWTRLVGLPAPGSA